MKHRIQIPRLFGNLGWGPFLPYVPRKRAHSWPVTLKIIKKFKASQWQGILKLKIVRGEIFLNCSLEPLDPSHKIRRIGTRLV
jgi:hypothetical protein